MKAQLTSFEQQHSKTQGTLKGKEEEFKKLQDQLKTVRGSMEEEAKRLSGQVAELQEAAVKKVRIFCNVDEQL